MNDIRKSNLVAAVLMYTIVIIFAILAIYPIFWVTMSSFKTTQEYMRSGHYVIITNRVTGEILAEHPVRRDAEGNVRTANIFMYNNDGSVLGTYRLEQDDRGQILVSPVSSPNAQNENVEIVRYSKLSLPKNWFFRNYPITWRDANFSTLISNSIFYTAITTISIIILSFMAGFAFAKLPMRITPVLHGSFIIGILITLQCIMVPLFLLIRTVGLYNTRLGVLIPYIGIGLPIGVYLATEYIKGIPNEIIESARIDGAKYFGIFWKIILPMAAPVATTVAILQVTGTWNEFMLINILVSSDRFKTVPLGINMFSGALATDYGKQFTALTIGMLPMIIFYIIFRKQITKGVSAGAVKG